MELIVIIILAIISLAAGLIDSIAGGGGLLMIPSLLIAGLQPQYALGTNKLVYPLGTFTAFLNFFRKKKIALKIAAFGIPFAVIGGFAGSKATLSLSQELLSKLIILLLPIAAAITLYPKKQAKAKEKLSSKDLFVKVPVICAVIGFYDGFFGPGTGSFLAIAFYAFIGLNLIEATANAKIINLSTNIGALISFIMAGKVIYLLAIPLALTNIIGNYIGSDMVIDKGEKVIKAFLGVVLTGLMITLIWKFLL